MPDLQTILLLVGAGGFGSVFGVVINLWLGKRGADNADVRLGLDALVAGMAGSEATVDRYLEKLKEAEDQIDRLYEKTHLALTENNQFRLIHGEPPTRSLDEYNPLDNDAWGRIMARLRRAYSGDLPPDMEKELDKMG